MPSEHFIQANPPLSLDSLPEFMKTPAPQVRFNSAFPPLTTKVRVRSVMERAGFDVYRPEKDRSVSATTKSPTINDLSNLDHGKFYPPNKFNHSNKPSLSNNSSPKKLQLRSSSYNTAKTLQSSTSLPINGNINNKNNYNNNINNNKNNINNSINFENPAIKTRNFTENPQISNNNSTPNLLNNNSYPQSNISTASPTQKKSGILNYAKQRLNLNTNKSNTVVPLSSIDAPTAPGLIIPDIELPSPTESKFESKNSPVDYDPNFNFANDSYNSTTYNNNDTIPQITGELIVNDSNDSIIHHSNDTTTNNNNDNDIDPFKVSKLPQRETIQLHGPRPYLDSDSNSDSSFPDNEKQEMIPANSVIQEASKNTNIQIPFIVENDSSSQRSSVLTTSTNQLETQLVDSDNSNPNILNPWDMKNEKNEDEDEDEDDEDEIHKSRHSAQSVGSFDAKFMLQAHYDEETEENNDTHLPNVSQESFGGLSGFRNVIKSTEFKPHQDLEPLIPEMTNPYDNKAKRISTLSTNDMKIYNLESLDNDNVNTDEVINEATGFGNQVNEMSIIQEGDIEDSRLDNLSKTKSIDYNNNYGGSGLENFNFNFNINNNTPNIVIEEDQDFNNYEKLSSREQDISENQQNEDYDDNTEIGNDQLLQAEFTKRKASSFFAPNTFNQESLPQDPVVPVLSQNEVISELINNIDNFGIEVPPRYFEKQVIENSHNESTNNNSLKSGRISNSHPYAMLSHNSRGTSLESNTFGLSSGFTTPDSELFDEQHYQFKHEKLQKQQQEQQEQQEQPQQDEYEHENKNEEFENEQTIEAPYNLPGKGPCRKCGKTILESEKKIWSKDNQLSGQWHRSCFGCNKCGIRFNKGSSCYVFNDQPYCESHFHELNGSLCQICNKGVEGECLQNDVNESFHNDCLKCVICGLNVHGDYFIFRDEVMCEADAKELIYQIEEAEKDQNGKDIDKIIKRRTRVLYL